MQQSSVNTLKEYVLNHCGNIILEDDVIRLYFKEETYAKKQDFLTDGEVCKYEGFIINGCCKTYIVDKEGNEVILNLSTEEWWVSDLVSFQDQKPARLNITTLEKTTFLLISYQNKEQLLQTYPELERMFRILVQTHLASFQTRLFNNFALTAEERYELLQLKRPKLFERVPQYLIASYLGVTPEFLSRVRAKRFKK